MNCFKDKTILVTGGVGSIGSEIVKYLLTRDVKTIRVFDINESGLFDLAQELETDKIRTLVGDVRDKERLRKAISGVDIVFHAAALKHVTLCEYNPLESIKTNIVGTQNIVDVSMEENVERLISISTDKAVNPRSVMGATKLLSERLITASFSNSPQTVIMSSVRFGNVVGSNGSVIPLFKRRLEQNKSICVTDPKMTRFIMSIKESVYLICKAAEIARGGEIFILKMPAIKIKDLAEVMIDKYGSEDTEMEMIGCKLGEKMNEELITEDELSITYENDDMFIISPYSTIHTGEHLIFGPIDYRVPEGFKLAENPKHVSNINGFLTKQEIEELLDEYYES